jgi:hypothetical protein
MTSPLGPGAVRGIVFEEDAARAIERRLRADGYAVSVSRARFAGEDDDEDQPWAVATDAPAVALELLLDAYDGWLDDTPTSPGSTPGVPLDLRPLDLPSAPRRHHRDPGS